MDMLYIACYGNGGDDAAKPKAYVCGLTKNEDPGLNEDGSPKWPDSLPHAPFDDYFKAFRYAVEAGHMIEQYRRQAELLPTLPGYGAEDVAPGLYLGLFHGYASDAERQEGDDWGEKGPLIGPLKYVHVTYLCDAKIQFVNPADAQKYGFYDPNRDGQLRLETAPDQSDCLRFGNMGYGDFSVAYYPLPGENHA